MGRELDDFHPLTAIVHAREKKTGGFDLGGVLGVHFIAVAVTLVHRRDVALGVGGDGNAKLVCGGCVLGVESGDLGGGEVFFDKVRGALAETHCAAHMGGGDLRHEDDDPVRGAAVELLAVRLGELEDTPAVLHHGQLHTEADAQEWVLLHAGEPDGVDLAFHASIAKAARHEDGVGAADRFPRSLERRGIVRRSLLLEAAGLHPVDRKRDTLVDRGVLERLDQGEVGILQARVLAHDGHTHGLGLG
mmetsp:Transcript_24740/g.69258  ORF Transcript_24740/g.69258 Transcript_24740/m.69258 type:complete len:247 (-) Transcript_24740:742-1482(-)